MHSVSVVSSTHRLVAALHQHATVHPIVRLGFDTTVIAVDGIHVVEVHRHEATRVLAGSRRICRVEPSGVDHAVGLSFILSLLTVLSSL